VSPNAEAFLWGLSGGIVAVLACASAAVVWLFAGGRAQDEEA